MIYTAHYIVYKVAYSVEFLKSIYGMLQWEIFVKQKHYNLRINDSRIRKITPTGLKMTYCQEVIFVKFCPTMNARIVCI